MDSLSSKTVIRPTGESDYYANKIAAIIRILAIATYAGGFICGIIFAYQDFEVLGYKHTEFIWSIAILAWSTYFVLGTVFLGFSEIIRLLHTIQTQNYESYIEEQSDILETSDIKKNIASEAKQFSIPTPVLKTENNIVTFNKRPTEPFECPICHKIQKEDRELCWNCGVKFIFANENVSTETNPK